MLSDEIHAPLVLPGAEFVPFLSVSEEARRWGFSFLSASKGWNLGGLKAAVVVTAAPAPKRYVDRLSPHSLYRTGHLGVLATVAALNDGGPWLADALEVLDHNRRLLGGLLGKLLPDVRYRPPQASFLAWLDFRALGWGDDPRRASPRRRPGRPQRRAPLRPFRQRLRAAELRLRPGDAHRGFRRIAAVS
ncbi:hypothetical protein ACFWJW_12095 [Streptomyces sp. NPDC127097]|uniref:hypothetical protein n=1 Tax=Streptomyces sp. NPDC127097 TaxID=3347136 RepID=UPI003650B8B5